MKRFIIDIETDGLSPSVIWCCGIKEIGLDNGLLVRTGFEFQSFLDSNKGSTIYAHNGFKFDYPILRDLWSIDFSDVILADSLVMSRQADPRRQGGNSLKAWGHRLGFPKGLHCDWSQYTEEMVDIASKTSGSQRKP